MEVQPVSANHPALAAALLNDAAAAAAAQLQAPASDIGAAVQPNPQLGAPPGTAVTPPSIMQAQTGPQDSVTREPQRGLERPGGEALPASIAGAVGAVAQPALAPETQITPAQVSTLQGQPTPQAGGVPQRPARPQRRDASGARRRLPQDGRGEADDADAAAQIANDADAPAQIADDVDDGPPQIAADPADQPPAAVPRRAPADAAAALYRRLVLALQAGAPPAGLSELALARRVLLVAPGAATGPTNELVLHLLWIGPRGIGRARRYAARGTPASGGAAASGWRQWRLHRDVDRHGQARLVVSAAASAPAAAGLGVRLAGAVLPPPLNRGDAAWLDVIDTRRLLHDLGHQWSVLLLWAPHPVATA